MAAYVISDVSIQDPATMQIYRSRAEASIAKYGGQYLARGGAIDRLEGGWAPDAIVIVQFASAEQARRWYDSPEYAEALQVRDQALRRRLILVDGVAPPGPDA